MESDEAMSRNGPNCLDESSRVSGFGVTLVSHLINGTPFYAPDWSGIIFGEPGPCCGHEPAWAAGRCSQGNVDPTLFHCHFPRGQ